MNYPFNSNRIEQLDIDPVKKINGLVWFNRAEKVYKTYVDENLQVFMTDISLSGTTDSLIQQGISQHGFTLTFDNVQQILIKHNHDSDKFHASVFDSIEKCTLPCSVNIIDENMVSLDFVEPITGHVYMFFE